LQAERFEVYDEGGAKLVAEYEENEDIGDTVFKEEIDQDYINDTIDGEKEIIHFTSTPYRTPHQPILPIREVPSHSISKVVKIKVLDHNFDEALKLIPKKWMDQLSSKSYSLPSLCEIEFELGRPPCLYFFKEKIPKNLLKNVEQDDLIHMTKDRKLLLKNRSFIEGTLHRLSVTFGIENELTAVTLRIGRPIVGISEIFSDLIEMEKSILFLGPPGLGKTSMIRDLARKISSMNRKTIIIDSSCEITGYKANHEITGDAYVMYVPLDRKKEDIMIQAVENRTPDVLIVDEISTLQEYAATQTASTRGVKLYATAHGTLKDIKKSTVVLKCLGGVVSVTLGDEAARENNGEKTKLESRTPPLFDVVVEFDRKDRYKWYIYEDITSLAKCLFKNQKIKREVRIYNESSESWSQFLETVDLEQDQ
jgi:stage III sporulation protein SpoIIIAA